MSQKKYQRTRPPPSQSLPPVAQYCKLTNHGLKQVLPQLYHHQQLNNLIGVGNFVISKKRRTIGATHDFLQDCLRLTPTIVEPTTPAIVAPTTHNLENTKQKTKDHQNIKKIKQENHHHSHQERYQEWSTATHTQHETPAHDLVMATTGRVQHTCYLNGVINDAYVLFIVVHSPYVMNWESVTKPLSSWKSCNYNKERLNIKKITFNVGDFRYIEMKIRSHLLSKMDYILSLTLLSNHPKWVQMM